MNRENYCKVLSEALDVLRRGGIILYPTDTVWGLGCDATNPAAVARIYGIKRRSDSKSLVLLACDLDMVARYVRKIPDIAVDLVEVNDSPMTIIYPDAVAGERPSDSRSVPASSATVAAEGRPRSQDILGKVRSDIPSSAQVVTTEAVPSPLDIRERVRQESASAAQAGDRWPLAYNTVAEDGSVGIRIPLNDFCQELTRRLGRPLVSTSANISGNPTPKAFKDIDKEITAAVDYVVAPSLGAGATGKASQIIKLGVGGEVEIIRA